MTDAPTSHDVVEVLATDHREVTALLEQLKTTVNAEQRRELADVIIAELVRHSVVEEAYVYPVMRDLLPSGEEVVNHDLAEHKELERILKDLEGADAAGPGFTALISELEAALRDHIRDEEGQQFPQLRAQVPTEKLTELAAKVETAKRLAPTRPHPASPNSPVFHKLVGPGVGLVDRLRDKLTGRSTD